MSLPDAWVDRIFAKLTVTYGAAFLRRYDGIDIAAVKADWAEVLSGYQQMPEAIRHGLEHLPSDKPPTVLEFRDACRRSPAKREDAIGYDHKPADPAVAAKVRDAFKRPAHSHGYDGWAHRLRNRELAGEKLSAFQRDAWRSTIGGDLAAQGEAA